MSFTLRLSFGFLALSLTFISPNLAQSQSTTPGTAAQHSADVAELRSMAEAFFGAWAAKDLDAFLRLWSAGSPELESRRKEAQELFATSERIEIRSLNIRAVNMDGGQARVRVDIDVRVIESQSGKEKAGYGKMPRTLEYVKEAGHWKVRREASTHDEIVAALAAAGSEKQRTALLAEERELVSEDLLIALISRGNRFGDEADYSKALAIYNLAQNIAEQLDHRLGIAVAQGNIGNIYWAQGDYAQALDCTQKVLVIFETLGDKGKASGALNNIGTILRSQGDYARALEYFQKGLTLDEALADNQAIAIKLNNIGGVYRVQGNHTQALRYYQKSLTLNEALKNRYGMGINLHNIGLIYRIQGDYAQAMDSYEKSLAMREAITDRAGIASTLNNIGRVHYAQGDYVKAIESLKKSLELEETIGDKDGIADTLNNLGEVYEKQGHYEQALDATSRASALARQIGDTETLWKARSGAGAAYRALKEYAQARLAFVESIAIIETLRANVAGGGEERQRFFESKVSPYHALVDLLIREGQSSEALTFAERAKARVLLDVLQTGRINGAKALTGQERERERILRAELISLNIQVTRASQKDKSDQARLEELKSLREKARLDYEAFQTSLYAAHPELKVNRGEAPIINAEELAALLPDATSALLEYVVTDEATYLFVATRPQGQTAAETKVFTIPIKQSDLAKQIESFRRRLAERNLGVRAPARKLYDLLLKPARALLVGKSSLVIAPDDRLWDLPFQALLDDGGRYVIERSAVSYAPSLTVLREMRARRDRRRAEAAPSTLLAIGNPLIGQETVERARLTLRDEKFYPLPEAEAEVRALGWLYGARRSKVYIGAAAREDRLKAEAGQARIIHFATHGVLNNAAPLYSYLALARGDKNEDGLLEAWELMQLDLKADLAVLSACETARGRTSAGEGMIGLTWALFVAGTPATVVSQWEVESASARDLMLGFHRRLQAPRAAGKQTKAESLRRAALKLMNNPETNHPFYWAGFVLVGDGR